MPDRPLPPAMHQKWGKLRWIKYKGNGEWSSECPNCKDDNHDPRSGDPDRFVISEEGTGRNSNARGWCRRCGHLEWLDDNPSQPITPAGQKRDRKERRRQAQIQEQKYKDRQEWLRQQTFWREYHDQMSVAQKQLWYDAGVGEWAIDIHKLGYSDQDDGALSIPYLSRNGIITLQFRLMNGHAGDKYRFLSGTRAEIFRTWPEDRLEGIILITEGVKKGIVTFQQGPYTYQGKEVIIVAVPMKNVPDRLIKQMSDAELLIWMLDPDAYEMQKGQKETMVGRNIRLAGIDRCRTVEAPDKIDDLFNMGLTGKAFQHMLNQAKPYLERS